jgi:hypothetical protein
MVSQPRSWLQFPVATQFSTARISPSLASTGPTGMTAPEQEQVAQAAIARMNEGKCWTIA